MIPEIDGSEVSKEGLESGTRVPDLAQLSLKSSSNSPPTVFSLYGLHQWTSKKKVQHNTKPVI